MPVLTPKIDIANVRLRFASGCIANLTASRISRDRVRKIRFFQPDSYVSIDYAAQELEVWRLVRPAAGLPGIEGGIVPVANEEPLKRELRISWTPCATGDRPGSPARMDGGRWRSPRTDTERMTTVGER